MKKKSFTVCAALFVCSQLFWGCKKSDVHQSTTDTTSTQSTIVKDAGSGVLNVDPGPGNDAAGRPILRMNTDTNLTNLYQSEKYKVEVRRVGDVNYTSTFVYKVKNTWVNPFGPDKRDEASAHFSNFSFDGASGIEIRITLLTGTAGNITIRPLNYNLVGARNGNVYTFTMPTPKYVSIEINDALNPLMLFGDAPEINPPTATNYASLGYAHYYGRGVNNLPVNANGPSAGPYEQILNSNQKVYIAPGAIVQGRFLITNQSHYVFADFVQKTNVGIFGRGLISMGKWPWVTGNTDTLKIYATVRGRMVDHVTIDGPTFVNATGNITSLEGNFDNVSQTYQNHDNQLKNIKAICFNLNTDNTMDGNNNTFSNWFMFNNDDFLYTHGVANSTISNCTAYLGYAGRLLNVDNYNSSNNFTMDHFNVIQGNVRVFSNLIEIQNDNKSTTDRFTENNFNFTNIRIEKHGKWLITAQTTNQGMNHWLFNNVAIDYQNATEGVFKGNVNGTINDIVFKNFTYAGTQYTTLSANHMTNSNATYTTNLSFNQP